MAEIITSATFSVEELWLLQSVVRHEMHQEGEWDNPPVSYELNQQIADALLACETYGLDEYTLELSMHDCLVVDYHVRDSMKSAGGSLIGRDILLSTFEARQALRGEGPVVEEPDYGEVDFEAAVAAAKRKRRKNAKPE